MLNLHPQYRRLLLALSHSKPVSERVPLPSKLPASSSISASTSESSEKPKHVQQPLTPEILDEYEELVGQSFMLRKLLFGEFRPENYEPEQVKTLEVKLNEINNRINAIIQNSMPHFYDVHKVWFEHSRASALGSARRAFKKPWQPFRKEVGGVSKFVASLVIIPAALCFLLLFRPPDREDTQLGWLNEDEKQLHAELEKGFQAGNSAYLDQLIGSNLDRAKGLAWKLINQGKDLLAQQDSARTAQAEKYFALAGGVGVAVQRMTGDGRLLSQTEQLLGNLNPQSITAKSYP